MPPLHQAPQPAGLGKPNQIVALGLLSFVVALHHAGHSLREIAERLAKERNLSVSHQVVRRALAIAERELPAPEEEAEADEAAAGPLPRALVPRHGQLSRAPRPSASPAPSRRRLADTSADPHPACADRSLPPPVDATPVCGEVLDGPVAGTPGYDAASLDSLIDWLRGGARYGRERMRVPRWMARQLVDLTQRLPDVAGSLSSARDRGASADMSPATAIAERIFVRGGVSQADGPDDELVEVVQLYSAAERIKMAAAVGNLVRAKYAAAGSKMQILHVHASVGGGPAGLPAASAQSLASLPPAALAYLALGQLPPEDVSSEPDEMARVLAVVRSAAHDEAAEAAREEAERC